MIVQVKAITSAVNTANAKVALLAPASKLVRRQTDAALAALVENLLLEIGGALNGIIGTLGLSKFYTYILFSKGNADRSQPHFLGR